jgi:hypothetical protein
VEKSIPFIVAVMTDRIGKLSLLDKEVVSYTVGKVREMGSS